jgi:hypothetical protein
MRWICLLAPGAYLVLCAASIAALFISTEPLVGLYAVFLAWPWSFVLEFVVAGDSFLVNMALIAAAFLINAALLYAACRLLTSLFRGRT